MKLKDIKENQDNPRFIKDEKFERLVKSIQDFPEMLEKRPLVIDEDNVVLGGNMRLKALKKLKYKEVPVIIAEGWTEEQKREFIIKDNVGFGSWDFDDLQSNWDADDLEDWGLDVWKTENEDIDYSVLDDEDLTNELSDMTSGVKKAIQIEFNLEHYEEAKELVKFWRDKEAYIGGMVIEYLKDQKLKI